VRVKKFLARSLPEAMAQVKGELGSEAIILHTQPIRIGGFLGLFGTPMIEVVAAAEQVTPRSLIAAAAGPAPVSSPQTNGPAATAPAAPAPAPPAVQATSSSHAVHPSVSPTLLGHAGVAPAPVGGPAGGMAAPATTVVPSHADAVAEELHAVKSMLGKVMQRLEVPANYGRLDPELKEIYGRLSAAGVDSTLAWALIRRIRSRLGRRSPRGTAIRVARDLLEREMEAIQPISLIPGKRRVVALVGPTGVGKTTTLAKLAALHALGKKIRVSLITADTYRIAAVEQLRTYCEIIRVPLEVCHDPADVKAALRRQEKSDLVLVDTAGRSPRNLEHMGELRRYLAELEPDETFLVMSLTSSSRDAGLVADAYQAVPFDRFLFTKLDETTQVGLLYNLVTQYQKPLSYITTGQNVPDDIEIAQPRKLANAILGE
jgi:flagellar biosynthesis protein FlhF